MKKNLILLPLLVIVLSCNNGNNPVSPTLNPLDSEKVEVEFSKNSSVFQSNDPELVDIDTAYTVRFIKSGAVASRLVPGNVILIKEKLLRKVSSIEIAGDYLVVHTDHARLNEAIVNGEIIWSKTISFDPENIPMIMTTGGELKKMTKVSRTASEVKLKIGDFDVTISFDAQGDNANVSCAIEKSLGVAKAEYKMEGSIRKFQSKGDIKYVDTVLNKFEYENSGAEGELTVSLTATSAQSDLLNGIELPVVLLQVPYIVGGIPVMLKIKMLLVINTVMPSVDASAMIKAKFKYNSSYGIKYDGAEASAKVNQNNFEISKDKNQIGASASVGANFGIAFPRVEVALFGDVIVPYIQSSYLIGGTYTFGVKSCQEVKSQFIGAIGYDFDFFGLVKFSGKKTLWQKEQILLKSGDCS